MPPQDMAISVRGDGRYAAEVMIFWGFLLVLAILFVTLTGPFHVSHTMMENGGTWQTLSSQTSSFSINPVTDANHQEFSDSTNKVSQLEQDSINRLMFFKRLSENVKKFSPHIIPSCE